MRNSYLFNSVGVDYPVFEQVVRGLIDDGLIRQRLTLEAPRYDPMWELCPGYAIKSLLLQLRECKEFFVGLWHFFRS
jgi:hypothetical protein